MPKEEGPRGRGLLNAGLEDFRFWILDFGFHGLRGALRMFRVRMVWFVEYYYFILLFYYFP